MSMGEDIEILSIYHFDIEKTKIVKIYGMPYHSKHMTTYTP